MSGSQSDLDEKGLAAGRIAADPVFSALEASGAPILAAAGDPLRLIHLNASARAVFGEDADRLATLLFRSAEPGARRLAELVESARHGGALRLERLRFERGEAPQTVTVLCRKLADDAGPSCFVIAALGVRPESAAREPPRPGTADLPAPRSPESGSAENAALRERLAARHGARAPRFLWRTDADGRFVEVTHVLADVVGDAQADILGRAASEVARAFSFGEAFERALASGKSWSGVEVDWPLDDGAGTVPVTLGALPARDADRRFSGYQGYGVLRLDRACAAAPPADARAREAAPPAPVETAEASPPPQEMPSPEAAAPKAAERPVANVVPLRPAPPPPKAGEGEDAALTSSERSAFEEIARALREGDLIVDGEPEPPPPVEAVGSAPAPQSRSLEGVLDCLPVGVLVARGAHTLFANRTLLDYLGYADRAALNADGGLARLFFGRAPVEIEGHAASIAVQTRGGEALDVDAHLQSVEWEGAPATMLTLRRSHNRPARGPEASALALARALEEKLARARADNSTLRAVLEASGAAIAVVGEDGRIDGATERFAALFGGEKGDFDGQALGSLFAAEDARALAARMARLRADEADRIRLVTRTGRQDVEASLRRLSADGARSLCVILTEPESRRGADELEAARAAAEQASAAKSDFLARVSHEIRTPLNAIIGFAEVMMEERLGPIGSERYKEYLKDVHASGAHVLSLVNDLLDLSKIEAGKMELAFERVDANAVINECVSIMQAQASQGRVVMRLALAPRLPPIRADARSLKQILLNLLSNAVKFNEPGGQVIVSTALTEAGFVVIRVKDTGVGMSEEEVQTALEPFKQVATSRQVSQRQRGTGLGLPLTKALIEANHASFTIRSRRDEGTLIEIAFPPPQVLAAE